MTDIELLPLPEHTEAGEFTFDAHVFEHMDMVSYARANVAHATAAKDAEIEALRAEVAFYRRRCDALQAMQIRMRDPERQMVCDVLANGQDREAAGVGSYAALGGEDERG